MNMTTVPSNQLKAMQQEIESLKKQVTFHKQSALDLTDRYHMISKATEDAFNEVIAQQAEAIRLKDDLIESQAASIEHYKSGLTSAIQDIEKYKALCDQMGNALSSLNRYASQQICEHTETYRGGEIWEICCQCGAKWADDEGGKPEFVEPVAITNAIAALEAWRAMK